MILTESPDVLDRLYFAGRAFRLSRIPTEYLPGSIPGLIAYLPSTTSPVALRPVGPTGSNRMTPDLSGWPWCVTTPDTWGSGFAVREAQRPNRQADSPTSNSNVRVLNWYR